MSLFPLLLLLLKVNASASIFGVKLAQKLFSQGKE